MLRWLLVGVGDIATKRVIPAILEESRSRLAGVVTRDSEKAARYGVQAFAGLGEALRQGGFDAVYIATPVFLHGPQTIQALRARLHVLCEKPMAMNFAEAQGMAKAADESGRILGVAYYRRANPKVRRAFTLIRDGAIGQPLLAYATAHSKLPADAGRSWLFIPDKAGGGPLYDIGSHRIDLLNYFFGQPQEIHACLSNAVHPLAVEDSATVLIKYSSGMHAVVDVRWNSGVNRDEFRIIGTEGEMDLTPFNGATLVWPEGREDVPRHPNLHYPCIKNFVDAVLDQEPLISSGATALWTDWVTEKAVAGYRGSTQRFGP